MSVPAKEFGIVWNQAASVAEVAKHFAMKPRTVIQRACHLRKKGHKLKAMPRLVGPGAPGGRPKGKATALPNGTSAYRAYCAANGYKVSELIPANVIDAVGDMIVQLALQRLQERLGLKA